METRPRYEVAVLLYRAAMRRPFFSLLNMRSMRLRSVWAVLLCKAGYAARACSQTQRALMAAAKALRLVSAGRLERWYFRSPEARRSPTTQASRPACAGRRRRGFAAAVRRRRGCDKRQIWRSAGPWCRGAS